LTGIVVKDAPPLDLDLLLPARFYADCVVPRLTHGRELEIQKPHCFAFGNFPRDAERPTSERVVAYGQLSRAAQDFLQFVRGGAILHAL
jgi:hypothetical protein